MSTDIIAGTGTRYGVVFPLNSQGLMYQPVQSNTEPFTGYEVLYIKGLTPTVPENQKVTHTGNDRPFAQDKLPPTEFETFTMTTGGDNYGLDAILQQTKIRNYNGGALRLSPGGSHSNQGREIQCAAMFYRQAVDVDPESDQFGLRVWNMKAYPKCSFTVPSGPFEAASSDLVYPATPYASTLLPWGESFYSAVDPDYGVKYATHVKGTSILEPRINVWEGNGTAVLFTLSHKVAAVTDVIVFVDGVLQVPTTDFVLAASGAKIDVTLGGAPASGSLIVAIPTFL